MNGNVSVTLIATTQKQLGVIKVSSYFKQCLLSASSTCN